jgi:methylglutaconyl-CoA hydratase
VTVPAPATVRVERQPAGDGGAELVTVTLARPEAANALSWALVRDLRDALAGLRDQAALAAVVITGAGDKAFSAGADLKERRGMSLAETQAFLADLNALMDEVAAFPRAVIAAINGAAFGGGLELALAADLRIVAEGAMMGLTEVRLGIIPGAGGTQRLSRLVGLARAKELILTGRRVDAVTALALGLVTQVVPAAALAAAAAALAAEIALAGPLAVAQAKRAIDDGFGRPLAEGLAVERAAYQVVLASADRNEGLAAFAEKRKPRWQGK